MAAAHTQFTEVFDHRAAQLSGTEPPVRQRWRIWMQQQREGHAMCFGTCECDACREVNCRWRDQCKALRAEWQR